MKALVIISRDRDKASTLFRFVQYEAMFAEHGISLDYVRRDAIDATVLQRLPDYDVLINQKCLMNKRLAAKVIAASRRIVFDLDDAIWTRPGRSHSWFTTWRVKSRLRQWLGAADAVTAANDYLAAYARQFSDRVQVIHMALDTTQWQAAEKAGHDEVVMGWVGSPATVKYLESIAPQLCELLRDNPNLKLAVYSGKRPALACEYTYTAFAPGTEVAFMQQLDIGLLPLPKDDAFTRGKSPIKALQYLACGLPVVAQIRGATAEILNASNSLAVNEPADWRTAIESLLADKAQRESLGRAGRDFVIREHDMRKTVEKIISVLRGK